MAMAAASAQGLDPSGGMGYELEQGRRNGEKHWWVQAEAMVGFLNAFRLTGERHYYKHFLSCWAFTKAYLIDDKKGEWFWGINEDLSIMQGYYKAGLWKCPYHNGRACLEMIKRL